MPKPIDSLQGLGMAQNAGNDATYPGHVTSIVVCKT